MLPPPRLKGRDRKMHVARRQISCIKLKEASRKYYFKRKENTARNFKILNKMKNINISIILHINIFQREFSCDLDVEFSLKSKRIKPVTLSNGYLNSTSYCTHDAKFKYNGAQFLHSSKHV